jgi:hypothetical protein
MPGDVLVVELCRDDGEIRKHILADPGLCRTVGQRATLYAAGMLAQCGELRAGDRLTVRLPIEWEDIPPANLDEPDQRPWIGTRSKSKAD